MVFIPIMVPPPPSRDARELGRSLAQVVREQRAANPHLAPADVCAAFRLAREELREDLGSGKHVALVAAIAGLVALLGGAVAVFVMVDGKGAEGGAADIIVGTPGVAVLVMVLLAVTAVVGLVMAFMRR